MCLLEVNLIIVITLNRTGRCSLQQILLHRKDLFTWLKFLFMYVVTFIKWLETLKKSPQRIKFKKIKIFIQCSCIRKISISDGTSSGTCANGYGICCVCEWLTLTQITSTCKFRNIFWLYDNYKMWKIIRIMKGHL